MNCAIKCGIFQVARSPYWQMRYTLPGEKERAKSLRVRDERTATQRMLNFVGQLERELDGVSSPSTQRKTANADLETVLGEYLADLRALKCSAGHVDRTGLYVRKVAKFQGWKSIRDISAEGFYSWRSKHAEKKAPKTLNLHLGAMKSFLKWLENSDRLEESPLCHVKMVKDFEQTRPRRAFTEDEVARLLAVAPVERRRVYLLAFHTGLRRSEMETLEWQEVFLDEEKPVIRLKPSKTKNRKGGTVYLHPQLVTELREMRSVGVKATDKVIVMFSRLGPLKKDLAAAGIPFEDERGRRLELHATRKTFNTRLATNGVSTRAAMQAMRVTEERLATVVYLDSNHLGLAELIAALPSLGERHQVSAIVSGKSESGVDATTQGATLILDWKPTESPQDQGFSYSVRHGAPLEDEGRNGARCRVRTRRRLYARC